jgi:tellurite resistance protein
MYEKRSLYRAIAEMAYVIAKSHEGMHDKEKKEFFKIIEKELDFDAWAAESRFELLDQVTHPSISSAYNDAMFEFNKYSAHMDDDLKQKALRVLEKVAEAHKGKHEVESCFLGQIKKYIDINL